MLGVFESMYKVSHDGGQQMMHLLAFRRAAAHDDERTCARQDYLCK